MPDDTQIDLGQTVAALRRELDARTADVEIAQQLRALAESQQKAGVAPAIDVTRVLVKVGDTIAHDQPVVELARPTACSDGDRGGSRARRRARVCGAARRYGGGPRAAPER